MQFSQSSSISSNLKLSKSRSGNKMLKNSMKNSQKSSFKNIQLSQNKNFAETVTKIITANQSIKNKYFKPAIKQYQRSDAHMISRCINKDFDDSDGNALNLYQFLKFHQIKQILNKFEEETYQKLKQQIDLSYKTNCMQNSIKSHIFHFYERPFQIMKNRMLKLKNLFTHFSMVNSEKGSSYKNSSKKNDRLKIKSKSKSKNMDNLLKGLFKQKNNETKCIFKLKRPNYLKNKQASPQCRKKHILSKDSQDMNQLIGQLNNLLKAHSIQTYGDTESTTLASLQQQLTHNQQINKQQESRPSFTYFNTLSARQSNRDIVPKQSILPTISSISSNNNGQKEKSKIRQNKQRLTKNNELNQIMQSQMSLISAIKASQVSQNQEQYEFYGLSAIRDKKLKKELKNSVKNNLNNDSYLPNTNLNNKVQSSTTNQSRATNKRISTHLKLSNFFSEDTPKKLMNPLLRNIGQKEDDQKKKSKSRSRTLKKININLNEKSKSKSLSSTQKSLKKDSLSTNGLIKSPKLLMNSKSSKNINERLLFMQPLPHSQQRKGRMFIGSSNNLGLGNKQRQKDKQKQQQRKQQTSKSKSKGKLLIMRR